MSTTECTFIEFVVLHFNVGEIFASHEQAFFVEKF